MLINVVELRKWFKINPTSILHIGAHKNEELESYENNGWGSKSIIWVEAQEELAKLINLRVGKQDKIVNCLAWNKNNVVLDFNITNNSQSSSIFDLGTHLKTYPDIKNIKKIRMKSKRLDSILNETDDFELINIDVQGAELQVLEGLGKLLDKVKYIYSEVNSKNVYQNCTRVSELDIFLSQFGFMRVRTSWVFRAGWGDALYMLNPSKKIKFFGFLLNIKDNFLIPIHELVRLIKKIF